MVKDNNRSSFGLQNLRDGIEEKTSELSEDANARSTDGSFLDRNKPFTYEEEGYDRSEAPRDDMRQYWRQFETTPIVRKPITSFASRVTEPGYYIEAQQLEREEVEALGEWLDSCAIVEGMPGRDFRELAKKSIVQREVRGTALVEKAPHKDDSSKIAGLKLINPETVEAVSVPDQSILMPPDGHEEYEDEDIPEAEAGGSAAWLQDILETDQTYFRSNFSDKDGDVKIGFRRDEIIPLRRDADVGEIFGTSRLEAVTNRIEGLKNKLDDNDQAIASKAYPLYVFMFGDPETDEGVWDSNDISDFMNAHEMENFEPGMKQGVRGDVDIETVSGEVADIAEYLQFDIQWIMSSMPMPMFLLGSFSDVSVGQVAGVAQQQDIIRQIADARRELEEEFTPVIREVAKQKGISEDKVSNINLRFGEPGQTDPEVARSQQTIRYVSDAQGGQNTQQPGQQQQQQLPSDQPQTGSPKQDTESPDGIISKGETPSSVNNPAPDQEISGVDTDGNPFADMDGDESEQIDSQYAEVWDTRMSAELQQLIHSENGEIDNLAEQIADALVQVRDETLDTVEDKYAATPQYAVVEYSNIANRKLNTILRQNRIQSHGKDVIQSHADDVEEAYGDSKTSFTRTSNISFFAQNIEKAVRDAGEEMLNRSRRILRDGVTSGENWDTVRSRVENDYNEDALTQRADLIAQMEIRNAVETMKLQQFNESEDIVGVEIHNPTASEPITQSAHGTTAIFGKEKDIREQLESKIDSSSMQNGFDPLPQTPPYHFNDTTTLRPIYSDDSDEEREELEEVTGEELMTENVRREEELRQKKEQVLDELLGEQEE